MKLATIFPLLFVALIAHSQEATQLTDSSSIVSTIYPGGRAVKETIKRSGLTYYKFYRNNTKVLTSTAFYNSHDVLVGLAKEYDDNGNLLYSIDYDKGQWTIKNKSKYPFFNLQNKMKHKADSLIKLVYGKGFLLNQAIWNAGTSVIYNKTKSGNWTDTFKSAPAEFLFRYNVKIDKNHLYEDMIEFQLNAKGEFMPNPYEAIYGFERLANKHPKFAISPAAAIAVAKRKQTAGSKAAKPEAFLRWECFKTSNLYNGKFLFYVIFNTNSVKITNPKGRSSINSRFDVYSFNPWTGKFIEKKQMKSISSWEAASGSSTGLMPDN